MNALTEEGVSGISTYATHIKGNKEVKCGLITAIPPDPFLTNAITGGGWVF